MCIQYTRCSFAELQGADEIRKSSGFREYSHLNYKITDVVSEEEHFFFSSTCLQNNISTNITILWLDNVQVEYSGFRLYRH